MVGGSGNDPKHAFMFHFGYIYDWSSHSWCSTEPLSKARLGHACSLLDNNKVLIVGGITTEGNDTSTETLDLQTMKWSIDTELPVEAVSATLVQDEDEVLLLGAGGDGRQVWALQNGQWIESSKKLDIRRKEGLFLKIDERLLTEQ